VTARRVSLALGVAFAVLTILELLIRDAALGGTPVLERTTKANLIHWAFALALLGAFLAGARTARIACRVAGPALVALAAWGIADPFAAGSALGFTGGLPAAYGLYHGAAGVVAVVAAFSRASNPAPA
jgi:hypothetical protein